MADGAVPLARMSADHSPTSVPNREAVEEWIVAVRRQIQEVEARIQPLLGEQQALKQRESLLASLLKSLGAAADGCRPIALAPLAGPVPAVAPGESVHDYVYAGVRAVLEETAGPLHINEIHARFIARGLRVPGAGKPANLTAHLGSCVGIWSPRRGFYALATEGEAGVAAPARKPRRHRRRRRRAKG